MQGSNLFLHRGARPSAHPTTCSFAREAQLVARLGSAGLETALDDPRDGPLAGARLRDLRPGDPYWGEASGVLVEDVAPGSPAARRGLRPGDLVLAVNRARVKDVADLRRALARTDGPVALTVQRGRGRMLLVLR